MIPYKKVAEKALYEWDYKYSMNNQEEALKRAHEDAEKSSFEELESKVWAQGSMNYAIDGIANYLAQEGIELTPDEVLEYRKAIFEGPENAEIFTNVKDKLAHIKNPNKLIISTLSNIHDGWVKDNQKKFFARDKKYQHMPIELIGWNEVKSDLLFLSPILEASNLKVNEDYLEKTYNESVIDFFNKRNIKTNSDLQSVINQGKTFYPSLEGQDDILKSLSDSNFLDSVLLPQIQSKGIGNVETFISKNKSKFTPLDVELAVNSVTRAGINKKTNEIKKEFTLNKEENQKSNHDRNF